MGVSFTPAQLEKVSVQLTHELDTNLDNKITFKAFFLFLD